MSILVWPTSSCRHLLGASIIPWRTGETMPTATWMDRAVVEQDEGWQQPIPYVVMLRGSSVWCYRRLRGESRLAGQKSCGVGGHIEPEDDRDTWLHTAQACAAREVAEELGVSISPICYHPVAWIHEQETAVGRVHLGLVMRIDWEGGAPVPVEKDRLKAEGFFPLSGITVDAGCERWSRLAAQAVLQAPSHLAPQAGT